MALDSTIDPISFAPDEALTKLSDFMTQGVKYPQLRAVVVSWLAEVREPSTLVAACIDVIFTTLRDQYEIGREEDDDGELLICMYLLLECLGRTPGTREGRERRRFTSTVTRGVVLCDRSRAHVGKLVHSAMTTTNDVIPSRAIVRLIETFGLEFEDLNFTSCAAAAEGVSGFVRQLLEDGKQSSAMALIFHFNLEEFATNETLQGLAQCNEFSLALEFVQLEPTLATNWIEFCVHQGVHEHHHAALRQAHKVVTIFEMEAEFPDVRTQYYKSTIARMIAKGQFEVALKRAGAEINLQEFVVESLAAIEQFEYALEFANRCGLEFDCDPVELEKLVARRRATFFQLPEHLSLDANVVFVDDAKSLHYISERYLANKKDIGIDTEWGAAVGEDADKEDTSQVATLQLASEDGVAILDLPVLVQSCPEALENTIGRMFRDDKVLKLGFAVQEDLRRLAKCHPASFSNVRNVTDLQSLWKQAVSKARTTKETRDFPWATDEELSRYQPVGLSTMVAAVLGKPLDKTMRMSDWSKRPLTAQQRVYAALDAWTLVESHRSLLASHADRYIALVDQVNKSYEFK